MATFSYRRAHILAIVLLCVLVIVCVGGLFFAGNLARFQEDLSIREGRTALSDVNDPSQLERALRQYPSNRILRMVALANKDSIEMEAATRQLLSEAEPKDFSKSTALTASSRSDLEALSADLTTAESNAATLMPRYVALLKATREKLEHDARPLQVGNYTPSKFMAMIDEQHNEMTALMPKALAARAEYDGAYDRCVALLIQHSGAYNVINGQFIFPSQSAADSYNAAATTMMAAGKRIAQFEDERAALRQSQLTKWKSFVER